VNRSGIPNFIGMLELRALEQSKKEIYNIMLRFHSQFCLGGSNSYVFHGVHEVGNQRD
jgi:hypothetical protein